MPGVSATGEDSSASPGVTVRAALAGDAERVAALLYESAAEKYDQFAGDRRHALALLERAFRGKGNTASRETVRVAVINGAVAGAIATFPSDEGDRRARRLLSIALRSLAPGRWSEARRIFRIGENATPPPPPAALYVDALATDPALRRRGAARALLADAEQRAREAGLAAVALDTGQGNLAGRALYESSGFVAVSERAPAGELPGVVAYVKRLSGRDP